MLGPAFGLTEDDSRDRCHVFGLAEPLECHHGNLAVEAYAKPDKKEPWGQFIEPWRSRGP
jgi:hypothetical protein